MTWVRHRGLAAMAGLAAALALVLAGCAAPQYTYVANSTVHAYFKVPRAWSQIATSSLAKVVSSGNSPGSAWVVGYDASSAPSAEHVLGLVPAQPFAYATAGQPSTAMVSALSYNQLRDFFLPVTAAARQNAAQQGFPLTGFKLLHSAMLTFGQGIHGVREIFDYTYPGNLVVTFDQVALTNADNTEVYLLMVHCTASCYSHDQAQINTVMNSFTVRSP